MSRLTTYRKGMIMRYHRSQWEGALSDLKDAAHDAGVSAEQTDAWAVRHDITPDAIGSAFGAYDDAGVFGVISVVGSPHALRELAHVLPEAGAGDPDPLDRTVRDLVCAECGTKSHPFVVSEETEVCLPCHRIITTAPDVRAFPV